MPERNTLVPRFSEALHLLAKHSDLAGDCSALYGYNDDRFARELASVKFWSDVVTKMIDQNFAPEADDTPEGS